MKGIYDKLEQKLRDHALLKKEITNRKLELEFAKVADGNTTAVQTSNGNSDPVGRLVEKWEMDGDLITMKRRYATIDKFMKEIDESHKIILQMRYMSKRPQSWDVIALRVGYTENHCIRVRKQLLDQLADRLGWEVA
ncbi:DUF722 domain-containing protein [Marinilactibacillus psychrotolerans]|uniref:DUF722 domain-containing protein n=1 Tax=Marinilactibacillus psychrotolerans TaxID=191770 RepID=A0A5R9C420_9LACT|nr:DUF722 domain-containing protein [Marinilactibacillus psychrotolerans]TLQ07579.1 DUF722 domain-containing protein [Marinilactibacillus psychrotolerans]